MYDKQLDSGKGTLLHLCDDVIQQEVSASLMHFVFLKKKLNQYIWFFKLFLESF